MAAELKRSIDAAAHAAAVLLTQGVVEEDAEQVRVLVVTLQHATMPREIAEDGVRLQALFGNSREAAISSWPLAAEVNSAPLLEEEGVAGKAATKVELGAAAMFPWHGFVDATLRLRLSQPPLRSALADVLVEVPVCNAEAGEAVSREVKVPLKGSGGRWSLGSVALELEVRCVSTHTASKLFSVHADPTNYARCLDILTEAPMPVVPLRPEGSAAIVDPAPDAPSTGPASPTSCSCTSEGSVSASAGSSKLLLPVLLRRQPGDEAQTCKI